MKSPWLGIFFYIWFMKKILLLLFALLFLGCTSDEAPETPASQPETTTYNFHNMHYPMPTLSGEQNHVMLQYSGPMPIKRIGGLKPMDPATGFSYFFTQQVYDELQYVSNKIVIVEKDLAFSDPTKKTEIILNASGKIDRKINVRADLLYQTSLDTVKYFYDANGFLTQTKSGKPDVEYYAATHYYNSQRNLDSIVTLKYDNSVFTYKFKEVFSDYDTARNPLTALFMFDEIFLRTLSRNNYMSYEKLVYDADNVLLGTADQRNWTIPYDTTGNIIF